MRNARDQFSRPPLERIFAFHNLIQAGKYLNCSMLARRFEVHLLTVNRDLEFMRDRLGLLIEYEPARRGFDPDEYLKGAFDAFTGSDD
jgi:predicted DNA-binding transcriptional regulator YafY